MKDVVFLALCALISAANGRNIRAEIRERILYLPKALPDVENNSTETDERPVLHDDAPYEVQAVNCFNFNAKWK